MDTISRENNSYLPVAGALLGGLAAILAAVSLIQISGLKKTVAAHEVAVAKIDTIESEARSAATASDKASKDIQNLGRQTQDAFNQVGNELGNIKTEITKLTEVKARPAAKGEKGGGAPAVAGPDEYIVKAGDTGAKIARANSVSLSDLQSVNPGVNWAKLKVGEKIKLPKKA